MEDVTLSEKYSSIMIRSFVPFLLASLGFILFGLSISMPLFEWQISDVVTDSSQEVRSNPSPWISKLGDSLDDCIYPENINSVARLSQGEKILEQITRNINRSIIPWLWLTLFLCGIYAWWYTVHYKCSNIEVLISIVVATVFFCVLLNAGRFFYAYVPTPRCSDGTTVYNAVLSNTHYETLLVLFLALLAEAGAITMMTSQIVKAIVQRKQS